MSSNEFGTVNVRRGDRTREIDLVRQRYNRHRETLYALAADAPTEHLATEYARLIREIDAAIGKLGELEGKRPADTQPMPAMKTAATEPGSRPLVTPPGMIMPDSPEPDAPAAAMPRVAMIIAAGVLVLVLIGWLMWRASGERPSAAPSTQTTASTATHAAPVTPAPKPALPALKIEPATQDYGTIRKGTRAVRQFAVTNNGNAPISLQVARSTCRCLYYDYANSVAPHTKETVTVTIDGAKAKRGALHETVAVSSKSDPNVTGNIDVTATIR